jgi:hypothetical protein
MPKLKTGQFKELERLGFIPNTPFEDAETNRQEVQNNENSRKANELSFSDLKNKFGKLKEKAGEIIFGDEQETTKPSGLLENLDAYTSAPTRAAISTLQDDATNLTGAAEAAYKQFGASPKTAPSGEELAAKMRLQGIPKLIAGTGLEIAADPTAAISGLVKAASLPLIGVKYMDKVFDSAKVAAKAEKMYDAARALKAPRVNALGQIINGPSAVDQFKSARLFEEARDLEKQAEMLLKSENEQRALEALNEITSAPSVSPEVVKASQKELVELVTEPAKIKAAQNAEMLTKSQLKPSISGGVVDEVPAESLAEALKLSQKSNIPTPYGKIIVAPTKFENLQKQLKINKK